MVAGARFHNEAIVANSDIAQVEVIPQPGGSQYAILVAFKPVSARKIHAVTENNIGKRMAVLIDDEVVMAPMIRAATGEADRKINPRFLKMPLVSDRPLFPKAITLTFLDFSSVILIPYRANNLKICRSLLFSTECLIEGGPVSRNGLPVLRGSPPNAQSQ
jgi:hypothetical protein